MTTKLFKNFCQLSFILLFLALTILGQKPSETEIKDKLKALELQSNLLSQAEDLNDSLSKESIKLTAKERALMFANLANIWKQENPSLSKSYFEKAINEASPSMNDSPEERKEKITTLQELLSISVKIDEYATKTIINLLESISKEQPNQNFETSKALSKAALRIIRSNPKIGFDLASAALKLSAKPSKNPLFRRIIFSLAQVDKNLAEKFFLLSLKHSQITQDSKFIGDIVIFAPTDATTANIDFLSNYSKKLVLSAFSDELTKYSMLAQQNRLSDEQKQIACNFFLTSKNLEETIRIYLPEKAVYISRVSQQAELCNQVFSSRTTQGLVDELARDKKDLTIEELIQAGFDTKDLGKRAFYFLEAISRLGKKKEFEKIIQLLDSMDDETRRSLGTANDFSLWRALRNANAIDAVLQKIKDKNYGVARQIIEKTPLDLRPLLQISVGRRIFEGLKKVDYSNSDQSLASDLITDARQNLLKIDDPFSSVNLYLSLIHLYTVIEPNEVSSVFQETIKAINKADNYKNKEQYKGEDFFYGRDIIALPYLSMRNDISSYQLADIQKPYSRVRIKLGMLESTLKKYSEVREKNQKLYKTLNTQ